MALNDLLRNASSGMRRFFKGCYKLLYMKPVIAYKTLGCPAINEFRIHPDFKYSTKSYYPALLMNDEKKAKKIYSRVVDFDSNGIPMYRGFEQRYWPVTITQCALLNYNYQVIVETSIRKKLFLFAIGLLIISMRKPEHGFATLIIIVLLQTKI